MTEIKEAHEKALEAADGHPLDKECCDILFQEYLASMASQGFVMMPVEATNAMVVALLGKVPDGAAELEAAIRQIKDVLAARPKLET